MVYKMSKEKQIEELTAELIKTNSYGTLNAVAEHLYNAGYRKQSEGEWETILHYPRGEMFNAYSHICSVCKYFYKDVRPIGYDFCPNCGAKMKQN